MAASNAHKHYEAKINEIGAANNLTPLLVAAEQYRAAKAGIDMKTEDGKAAYLKISRTGAKTALNRRQRAAIADIAKLEYEALQDAHDWTAKQVRGH